MSWLSILIFQSGLCVALFFIRREDLAIPLLVFTIAGWFVAS
jgi:hypothetical protein